MWLSQTSRAFNIVETLGKEKKVYLNEIVCVILYVQFTFVSIRANYKTCIGAMQVNQIGTVTEAIEVVKMAKDAHIVDNN